MRDDRSHRRSRDAMADAAVWLARLRNENRTPADERNLRLWLSEDAENRRAFAEVTASWDAVGGVVSLGETQQYRRAGTTRRAVLAGSVACVVSAMIGGRFLWKGWFSERYETGIGELRRIALSDGSAVTLDTDSEVAVRLSSVRRTVELVRGRAHFEVAHDRARPFVVDAGGRSVTALGTAFDVSRNQEGVDILLVEGRVMVEPARGVDLAQATVMTPGEMLRLREGEAATLDRADTAITSAWQQGRLVLNDERLDDAVAEMNRYSSFRQMRVDDALADRRISGSYATQDIESFAKSAAALFGGEVETRDNLILLHAAPASPSLISQQNTTS